VSFVYFSLDGSEIALNSHGVSESRIGMNKD
jgi:hypothetical protein